MLQKTITKIYISLIASFSFVFDFNFVSAQNQSLNLSWKAREDLNILLPPSVKVFETNGLLTDRAKVRAMYAAIDLRDKNLKFHAVGSNTRRETTLETYNHHDAIFAINGGYFSATKSESILVSDGELVAPGPLNFTRGAFGLVNGKPEIVWPFTIDSLGTIIQLPDPIEIKKGENIPVKNRMLWHPSQAVGAGPVLVKEGKIRDASQEEGFGASHLLRHPRSAIGYINDHTVLIMVVDGRQQSSAGVTIKELAQMMFEVGCYEAVNLDGGGSSAMVAADEVVNVPVDIPNGNRHSLRRNASALVLTEEIASSKKKIILIDTESKNYQEHGIWKATNHVNFYGESASRQALANTQNKALYRFTDVESDSFQLAAWWTINEKNSVNVNYILHHSGRIDTLRVDQKSYSSNGRWNVFGDFFISSGDYLEVIGKDADSRLITDAIRLVALGPIESQPKRGDLRVAVISDLNSGLGSATYEWQVDSIIQRIPRAWRPDLVLCGGDMVAGMGVSDSATLTKMWVGFDERIAKPLRNNKIPFAFTIGNHDGLRSYPIERRALSDYWSDPDKQTGLKFVDKNHFPHYYSFVSGDAFFISWDASSSEITSENLEWVTRQFETPEAKNAKAKFVVGHLPIYSVAQERDSKGNVLNNGEALRQMLEKNKVKVYISGHQHAYYPGKRGNLQLLNCGAAGSGPRRWLTTDKQPVNTITIMDVFYERDTIVYTTYDIKHREAKGMRVFDYRELPSSISGVNGFVIRNDVRVSVSAKGKFVRTDHDEADYGRVATHVNGNKITISGTFNLESKLVKADDAISLRKGKHTLTGDVVFKIPARTKNQKSGSFSATFDLQEGMQEGLSVGDFYILIRSEKFPDGEIRAQLYSETNSPPDPPVINSHQSQNIYGIRDIKGLYKFSWIAARDTDGDNVSYIYQIASDSLFQNTLLTSHTNRVSFLKKKESDLFQILGKDKANGKPRTFYHRVIASDGLHDTASETLRIKMMKSDEALTDFTEVDPVKYVFDGKIENATGQGSGALWDNSGKLWLADYNGTLHVKLADGKDASFSPLSNITIRNKPYALKPINGIGLDRDGNILVACNRFLIKLNATTGEGIAAWEAPEGKRAITSPRVNNKGEIYAMSLFAEDPNYVLRQSTTSPETFELIRTITLPQRILARTFDMSADGMTLYFPDPGSAFIQKFTSKDGTAYKRDEDITSVAAGCNAISIHGSKLFATVRASGVSGSTLHFRNEEEKVMWTLTLDELEGAEARGMAVSPNGDTVIICSWDKGGGFYRYKKNP